MFKTLAPALSALLLLSCSSSSTRLVDSWRAPGTLSFVFQRVAVIALTGDPALRKTVEDEIVRSTKHGVAGYTVLGDGDMRSAETVKRRLLEQQFDGAVTMRLVRAEEINAAQSVRGESFSSYTDSVVPGEAPFGQGKIRIETNVYRLSDEKLLWTGTVETERSDDPQAVVRAALTAMGNELRDTGLIHD